jgi:hypothetical protein
MLGQTQTDKCHMFSLLCGIQIFLKKENKPWKYKGSYLWRWRGLGAGGGRTRGWWEWMWSIVYMYEGVTRKLIILYTQYMQINKK